MSVDVEREGIWKREKKKRKRMRKEKKKTERVIRQNDSNRIEGQNESVARRGRQNPDFQFHWHARPYSVIFAVSNLSLAPECLWQLNAFEFVLEMSKLLARIAGFFSNRTQAGVDKAGNRYFTRKEEIDGVMKEKRWVVFKREVDSTTLPVEWICWLNGQRKQAPTPEEMMELEARRERVRQNVVLLKKEEEERKAKEESRSKRLSNGKVVGPDLKNFIRQFPSEGDGVEESSAKMRSSEPTGSGATFKPGTWQPPT